MTGVIEKSKEHVWDALNDGFQKYLSVLTERAALIQETDALEQQVINDIQLLNSIFPNSISHNVNSENKAIFGHRFVVLNDEILHLDGITRHSRLAFFWYSYSPTRV